LCSLGPLPFDSRVEADPFSTITRVTMPTRLARLLAVLGLLLQLALWFALGAGALRMVRLLFELGTEPDQGATADAISEGAALALLLVRAGELLALSGLGLLAVAVGVGRLRERWIFWAGIIALAAWIPLAPYGPILGLGGIAVFVINRRQFLAPRAPREK